MRFLYGVAYSLKEIIIQSVVQRRDKGYEF